MNSKKLLLFLFVIFSFAVYAETELEILWNKAITHSTEVSAAEISVKNAIKAYKNKRSLYPVNLKFSTESSFNDIYEDIAWYPSSAKAGLTVIKTNPYGNSVSGTISYGTGRNILNFLEAVNSENIGYNHSPEANINIEQSLLPAFFQKYTKNPDVQLLKSNIQENEFSKSALELSIKQNVANLYIQERNIIRQIKQYEKNLQFYDEKIDAFQELHKKSQVSISDIWNLENKRWDCYKEYIEALNSKDNIELSLKNICGDISSIITTESDFPEFETLVLDYNPDKEKLIIELENLKLQNIVYKQSSAPKISLAGTFSENTETNKYFSVNYIDDKTNFNWTFSLGLSFSDFLSPSRKLKQQQFEDNIILCKKQINELDEKTDNQKRSYSELINSYQKQVENLKYILDNRKKVRSDYDFLYKNGKCSKLEFDEVNLSVMETEYIYKNLCDYLWLYKWMRTQCK